MRPFVWTRLDTARNRYAGTLVLVLAAMNRGQPNLRVDQRSGGFIAGEVRICDHGASLKRQLIFKKSLCPPEFVESQAGRGFEVGNPVQVAEEIRSQAARVFREVSALLERTSPPPAVHGFRCGVLRRNRQSVMTTVTIPISIHVGQIVLTDRFATFINNSPETAIHNQLKSPNFNRTTFHVRAGV